MLLRCRSPSPLGRQVWVIVGMEGREGPEKPGVGPKGLSAQLSSWFESATAAPSSPGFCVSTQYTGMAAR